MLLAYLIYPVVQRLRRRMPLVVAILLVYAVMFSIVIGAGAFVIPRVAEDIGMLVRHYPDFVTRMDALMYDPNDPLTSGLPDWMRAMIVRAPAELGAWAKIHGIETVSHAVVFLVGTFAAVATFVIVPVITAYLLMDLDNLKRGLEAIVPQKRWHATLSLLAEFDAVIGGFIRGQLIVAVLVGVMITIAMLLLRVPYAFLLGLLAGIGDLIPYVGAVLAFVPAVLSAGFANGWIGALIAAAAFVAIYELEGHIIAPNIVSRQVRLSPFVVLLALLIGAELGGLVGMLVAVPTAGVLRILAMRVFRAPDANPPGS